MRAAVIGCIVTHEGFEHIGFAVNQFFFNVIEQVGCHDLGRERAAHRTLFVYERNIAEHVEQVEVGESPVEACLGPECPDFILICLAHST